MATAAAAAATSSTVMSVAARRSLSSEVARRSVSTRAATSLINCSVGGEGASSSNSSPTSDRRCIEDGPLISNKSHVRSIHVHASTASFPPSPSSKFDNKSTISTGNNNGLNSRGAGRRPFSSGAKRDFYDVLGVARGSDKATIKKAYFKLAKQYHPDANKDDEKAADKFKEATEAYEVLSDDKQRELYDQFGHAGVDPNSGFGAGGPGGGMGGNPFGGAGGFQGFEGFNFGDGSFHFSSSGGGPGGQEIDAEELFDAFFGSGRRRPRGPRRGADLQMHVRLSFEEAVFGAKKDVHLRYQIRNPETGGVEIKEREVTVDTPAGIDHGMNLRLSGQGAEGDPGAPRGNLIVQVLVDEDEYFHRDGTDVHTEQPISIVQAILGGTVDVKTLTGTAEVKIPKGCQPDAKLALRGKGIQRLNGNMKGSHIVHLKIQIPKEITPRQEELLREFDEETAAKGRGISGGIAHAVGSAFEKFFGGNKNHEDKKDGDKKEKENDDSDDDEDERKQQAS